MSTNVATGGIDVLVDIGPQMGKNQIGIFDSSSVNPVVFGKCTTVEQYHRQRQFLMYTRKYH